MKLHELLILWNVLDEESVEHLNGLKRPVFLRYKRVLFTRLIIYLIRKLKAIREKFACRVQVPKDLNDITIGQVFLLSSSEDVFLPFRELLGLKNEQIALLDAEQSVGFLNFVRDELKRINDLLASTKTEPTAEERAASIEEVGKGVGTFGTLDYIAKRLHITHDQAADLKWPRVYAIMKIDHDNELFRRRLTDVYQRKRK